MGVQALDIVRECLNYLHDTKLLSWRQIAARDEYKGIPAGSLCSIANGRDPKTLEHRRILGLEITVEMKIGDSKIIMTVTKDGING